MVKDYMDDVIEDTKIKKFVMDLTKLTFMDSTGIGILIGRYKKITKKNGVVFITDPQPLVDKILTLSGIYQIMPKIEE
jgi:stage II sporulation protein AA (anti-sigma F factor antagonist)